MKSKATHFITSDIILSRGNGPGLKKTAQWDTPRLDDAETPYQAAMISINAYIEHLHGQVIEAQKELEQAQQEAGSYNFEYFLEKGIIREVPPEDDYMADREPGLSEDPRIGQ